MDPEIRRLVENLAAVDDRVRFEALELLLQLTQGRVNWADDVWDEMLRKLEEANSYQRSIGLMMLCNLAKSDTSGRMSSTLPLLLAHTRDEKFITSRQCLQNVWKIAAADTSLTESVLGHLEERFVDCADEPHANLLRRDIVQSFRSLYDAQGDPEVWRRGHALVENEPTDKSRKQYDQMLGVL
jgi:hypothetical protein